MKAKPMKLWAILDKKGKLGWSSRYADGIVIFYTNKKVAKRYARNNSTGGEITRVEMKPIKNRKPTRECTGE